MSDENKLYECTCNCCDRKFDEEEYKLTKDKTKCILHCEKSISGRDLTDNFSNILMEYISNEQHYDHQKNLILEEINFPNFNPDDIGDFTRKLTRSECIEFRHCNFYGEFLGFENFYCCFFKCIFLKNISISNIFNFNDTYLFINCKFARNIRFYSAVIDSNIFENCIFKGSIIGNGIIFKGKIFNGIKSLEGDLDFNNSTFEKRFIIDQKDLIIKKLDLEDSTFKNKFKLQFQNIYDANFYNTKFEDLADFYKSKFKKVNFERTNFEKISVFSNVKFNCKVSFKYSKFLEIGQFKDTIFNKKLDLRDSIFVGNGNFLGVSSSKNKIQDLNVANRETARIIKNFFDISNNAIEANKFYALEMEKREDELNKDRKKGKNYFEWLVFKIHGLSSNHSQDWLRALFWIITIGLMASLFNFYSTKDVTGIFSSIIGFGLLLLCAIYLNKIFKTSTKIEYGFLLFNFYLIYIYKTNDTFLTEFAKTFSLIKNTNDITFIGLIFKIIIAYLIYQFVISIRQNTRRK